jgi:hypothetical protein
MPDVKFSAAAAAVLVVLAANTGPAQAGCECRCVNGATRPICTSTAEIRPTCAPTLCPFVPPSLPPPPSTALAPPGTTSCSQAQVLNPATNKYEWQRICE